MTPLKRLLLVVVIAFGGIWMLIGLSHWLYDRFRMAELDTVAQFDELNRSVIDALPPPLEVTEIGRSSIGIVGPTNVHGRILSVEYLATDAANDVEGYYRRLLTTQGWALTDIADSSAKLYTRDTACIELDFTGGNTRRFEVVIWHDFAKQPFSPVLPPVFWLQAYEFFETQVYTCPKM